MNGQASSNDARIFESDERFPVKFDVEPTSVRMKISEDGLTLKSISPFAMARANCGVYKGKWMYEVQLHSKVRL